MTTKFKAYHLTLTTIAFLFASLTPADAAKKFYGAGQLQIKKVTQQKDGNVEITFSPLIETLYHCPGANAKMTDKGIELTFVRASYKRKPKVDYPAKSVPNKPLKIIVVPAKNKPLFLKDRSKVIPILPTDDKKKQRPTRTTS